MRKTLVITVLLWATLILGCKEIDNPPQSDREGALLDVNETSSTFWQYILTEDFEGFVSAWLFGHSTWSYCRAQFGRLDELQKKLDEDHPEAGIFILGVNRAGLGDNEGMCEGRDLPWLQDTIEDDWWGSWGVSAFDVVIIDRQGNEFDVFNLADHDLSDTDEFAALEAILLDVAGLETE